MCKLRFHRKTSIPSRAGCRGSPVRARNTELWKTYAMNAGRCLCGALHYETATIPRALVHCHCGECRKHHGAPFATFVEVPAGALRWVGGEESVCTEETSGRQFCGVCGSVAPTVVDGRVLLPAGNWLGELDEGTATHASVGDKAPWHRIADDLAQCEAAPAGWTHPATVVPDRSARAHGASGSCLCGRITFIVRGRPSRWLQCHCSRCRRARSAAHGSNAFYPAAQFEWGTGLDLVRTFRPPDAQRFAVSFCARCGGGAPVASEGVPFVLVPAGLLDLDLGARPEAHIHVASKAAWYRIADDLPQFAELPPR